MADKKKFNPAAAAEKILNISLDTENNLDNKSNDENDINNVDVPRKKTENISKKNMVNEKGIPLVQKSYYISNNQYRAINIAAAKRGIKSSEIVRAAIEEFLKNELLNL